MPGRLLKLGLVVCILGVALSAQSASAATRYAEVAGNGPVANCPQSNPCSIVDVMDPAHVADGDVIVIKPGTYAITDSLSPDHRVTIEGKPGAPRPLISADFTGSAGNQYGIFNGGRTVIRELNLDMNEDSDAYSAGIRVTGNTTIERVRVRKTNNEGIGISIGSSAGGTSVLRDSVVTATGNQPAIRTEGGVDPTGSNVHILNVTAQQREVGGLIPDALYVTNAGGYQHVFVRNDVLMSTSGQGLDVDGNSGLATVSVRLDHSNLSDDPAAFGPNQTLTQGAGVETTTAPTFVDPITGDFTELPGSVTIDGGIHDPLLGTLDYGRQPRLLDLRPDQGADELDVLVPTTTITRKPRRSLHRRRTRIKFTSNEPSATFECKLDKGRFKACRSPRRLRGLDPGRHRLRVRAVDGVGKRDPSPAVVRFRVVL